MIYKRLRLDESADISTGIKSQRLVVELTSVNEEEIKGYSCDNGSTHAVHDINDQYHIMFTFCPYLPDEQLANGLRELADKIELFVEKNRPDGDVECGGAIAKVVKNG